MSRLADLPRAAVDGWLQEREAGGMAARTRNTDRSAAVAFGNWLVEADRLAVNPVAKVFRADETADRRRERRALTEDELRRLLKVARLWPVAERGRETVKLAPDERKGRRTWRKAPLTFATLDSATERAREVFRGNPDKLAELEQTGRERGLLYKLMVLTGLREGEAASLTVGQVVLDGPHPYVDLLPANGKAARGQTSRSGRTLLRT